MPTLHKLQSAFNERNFDPIAIMHDQARIRAETFNEGASTISLFEFLSKPFEHHANFLSLSTIRTYETLSKHRWITSVDGVIPLVDFFIRFARPGNSLKTVILISEELKSWVPQIWADNVMLYSVKHHNKSIRKNSKNIFIGVCDSGLNTASELALEFSEFKKRTPIEENISVHLLNPVNQIIPHEKTRPFEHIRELLKVMNNNQHFEDNDLLISQDYSLNSKFYISKKIKYIRSCSELEHRLLSNGSICAGEIETNKSAEESLLISAHHSLEIYDCDEFDTKDRWEKIHFDVSRLGFVDNLIGQDLAKVLIEL
ncbi:MAG: hypothetical protein COW01_02530 [Bdellovibrionales bacterium CG12_big_fil_rev_8_21_14_0_65_38_15]|nr:MAG: hypothetical protein COW79_08195 [Bdellovibrionales bacterium CG22_combo_CG10-13_8_21_14_all_38_13]PIQ56969.1 MAG: hypothetical protein COW01_02530 [Bdellovibrionales bacterium CG12_big_fil_rev_8_21_14_0_65_38_15]PIR29070.1 MAG: hypothetical protein COV38_12590 [Bdellovibrionales bacterium CG11_big_fil_rev_8_21_14_0_20_38_13]